ncbi:MAG: shikimate kinase [Oscillospiraceae bacterium]|nr:shikimate kinase [Oscillospiraceae bacterium]
MLCGLLGRTLTHSYSPAIHEALGGGYNYELFEVEPDNLPAFLERDNIHGLNVTIPYKRAVLPYCAELSPTAATIGSVNTLLRRPGGTLYGDNTDAMGFLAMLHRSGIVVEGKKVLVLGSGGSGRTVCHVLQRQYAGEIVTISRSGSNRYDNLDRHADAHVIVNTTPVGMFPMTGETPIDLDRFPRLEGVLDLIYNPARTRLLLDAEARGIPHIGGLPMLVGQAAGAATLFSGLEIPREREQAALHELRHRMENLILIGMPGSGKTTVGRLAAKRLGRPFLDADLALEAAAGNTIPEIFRAEGETGFRRRETLVLKTLGKQSGLVIATGGGAVTQLENYPHLHQNGLIICLERDLTDLPREGRPLSQAASLGTMYAKRRPLYRHFADRTVANIGDPKAVADKVLEVFYETLSH